MSYIESSSSKLSVVRLKDFKSLKILSASILPLEEYFLTKVPIFFLNTNSLVVNEVAVFEPEVKNCKRGVPVQMMRKGYYVIDLDGNSFNRTVSLKEGWVG